ncbi:MAG: hypothetical protein QNK26_12950 [Moritella sp.]|uniref:hypothetical protein n=1 Tax=Moritella sp. TaxID=78556 RepID=UPI0029ADE63E|nr:hypothetical protein [Moritella sp.]MDX2321489.1 hypothetical protein [Moritella sp.]
MADSLNQAVVKQENLDPEISKIIASVLKIDDPTNYNDYETIAKVVFQALNFFPPLYVQSIFGPIGSWFPPHKKDSEFNIIDFWRPIRTANYLVDTLVPAFAHAPGPWARTLLPPVVQNLFWRPSNYFQQTDPVASVTSFINEQWIFVNGIATNEDVAMMNSELLSQLFKRPLTVVHNQTDSTVLDLVECVTGKVFKTTPNLNDEQSMTEPAVKATVAVLEALKDPAKDRVVLLCHSQGTIITANVLRALQKSISQVKAVQHAPETKLTLQLNNLERLAFDLFWRDTMFTFTDDELDSYLVTMMKKLEVYTFANCADKMNYVCHSTNGKGELIGLPYIENFANQFDLVARLGVLSPLQGDDSGIIEIDGGVYEKQGANAWGHLLNQHYLFGMAEYLQDSSNVNNPYALQNDETLTALPRLYRYYKGARPDAYYE